MAVMSSVLLAVASALQVGVLVMLWRGRMMGQVVLFTALLIFYALRSAVLFAVFGHLSRAAYGGLYRGLSWVDVLLQVAVAVELGITILRAGERPVLPARVSLLPARLSPRALLVPGFFLAAAGLTAIIARVLPAFSPAPADRGAIFTGLLFVQLFGWSLGVRLSPWARAVAAGLATVGLAGVLSQTGKSVAAFHRDGHSFVAWSYGDAAVYLVVLAFWVGTLWRGWAGWGKLGIVPEEERVGYVPGEVRG